MQSRFDAAALDPTRPIRAGTGRISGLLLSIALRGAMRLVAVFA
ncbi:MAG TPA: hypothetical protein VFF72_07685 [Caldimonas sp.]|nr:hypothetical protein [Caldimonas sp.]